MEHLLTKIAEYAVVVNSKKEFLLLQFWENHENKWHFPGGRLNVGDQSIIALKREVLEETNLDMDNIEPFYTKYFDKKSPKYAVFFKAKAKEPYEVKISDEHQNFAWFKKSEINQIDFKENFYKEILLSVL